MERFMVILLVTILLFDGIYNLECEKVGRFPVKDDCQHYIVCTRNLFGILVKRTESCTDGTLFSAKFHKCIAGDDCLNLTDVDSVEFDCPSAGNFVSPNSFDCRQFISCLETEDEGIFDPRIQDCPESQIFSSSSLECVEKTSFMCPGIQFECSSSGRFPDKTSPNCKNYFLCSRLSDGTYSVTSTLCPGSTVFSWESLRCVQNSTYTCPNSESSDQTKAEVHFECAESGRFADQLSSDCKSYYLCSRLSDGSFSTVKRTCPGATIFSWNTLRCIPSATNSCPNSIQANTVAEETTEMFSPTTQQDNFQELTSEETFESDSSMTTIGDEELTTQLQESSLSDKQFICRNTGRYPDTSSTGCNHYYLCTVLSDGTYSASKNSCPPSSVFSWDSLRCVHSSSYECPNLNDTPRETTESFSIQTSEEPFRCMKTGRFPDKSSPDCTEYYLCTVLSDGSHSALKTMCPLGSVFSWETLRCVKRIRFACPNTASTQNDVIETSTLSSNGIESLIDSDGFQCVNEGSFPDRNSIDCTTYYLCSKVLDGAYLSLKMICPASTIFSSESLSCVNNSENTCPGSQKLEDETTDTAEVEAKDVSCTGSGRIRDETSEDCKTYFLCTKQSNGTYLPTKRSCPGATVFSWETLRCTKNYECPKLMTTTTITTQSVEADSIIFKCLYSGRYPDQTSPDCSEYFLCSKSSNGTYSQIKYSCPGATIFSWITRRCVAAINFNCPNLLSSETPSIEETSSSESESTSASTENSSSTSSASESSELISDDNVQTTGFICPAEGRFPDEDSPSCITYFICSLDANGQFSSTRQNCPGSTIFSRTTRRCVLSSEYMCPAPTEETTPPTTVVFNGTCTETGKFPDYESNDCKSYHYCLSLGPGSFYKYTLACPDDLTFNPSTQTCTSDYNCPKDELNGTEISVASEGGCIQDSSINFLCYSTGRFADENSSDCRYYILCLKTVMGDLVYGRVICPVGHIFARAYGVCVPGEVC